MKKPFHHLIFLSFIISISFASCVSSQKYKASEARANQLQNDKATVQSRLNDCNTQVNDLNNQKTALMNENSLVLGDLKTLSAESKMTIADQAKRLKRLQDMIQAQKNVMTKLKNSIADAMMSYKTDELNVYIKDGNVYVSLAEKLLFKSGSDVVDPKGKEALKSLALVINNTNDISVMIEGHTDNVPIKTKVFKDNWDLSTARATAIVRILTVDNGFDSNRITASGRSQFHPIMPNEAIEGRAANRRTEIILSPDLKEIYKLLE
ncbi:MAG: OmpA family protein [Prolixibacteraceae bacterium]|jgi:chemotaxis protein MotB|nr:OmpA family protein [Prolixibacteraceae bacterium]